MTAPDTNMQMTAGPLDGDVARCVAQARDEALARRAASAPLEADFLLEQGARRHTERRWRERELADGYALAHDLRGALTTIATGAHALDRLRALDRIPSPECAEIIEIIRGQTTYMNDLIERDLVGSTHAGGDRAVDLVEVVCRAVQARIADMRSNVVMCVALQRPTMLVQVDPVAVRQVVANLLDNAIKFSPRGGYVQVRVHSAGSSALLEVCDEGIGVAKEECERLFEYRYRGANARAARIAGSGLGLHTCRELLAAEGGAIWACPHHPQGAEFCARMPLLEHV